jgi:hypothetical protein
LFFVVGFWRSLWMLRMEARALKPRLAERQSHFKAADRLTGDPD